MRARKFENPYARAAWLGDLIENEQVDAAARLGWVDPSDPFKRPNTRSAKEIEAAWGELEAAVSIQRYARSRLAARLYNDRLRKLQLFRLYARTEQRAAMRMQHAFRRLVARKEALRNWRDALDAATPDVGALSARLARAAALLQASQRAAHRAALLEALRGKLHVRTRRGLLGGWLGRFEERHIFATDDCPEGAAICWRPFSASKTERTVPIANIRVHSELRYEFALEAQDGKLGRGKVFLFRAPAQHTMEQWVRNLHALVVDCKYDVEVADSASAASAVDAI